MKKLFLFLFAVVLFAPEFVSADTYLQSTLGGWNYFENDSIVYNQCGSFGAGSKFKIGSTLGGNDYVSLTGSVGCNNSYNFGGFNGSVPVGGYVYFNVTDAGGTLLGYYFQIQKTGTTSYVSCGVSACALPDSSTRIISVLPVNNSATSSPYTIIVTGYVNESDFSSSTKLTVGVSNYGSNMNMAVGVGFVSMLNLSYEYYPTSFGDFSFSTTTISDNGSSTMKAELYNSGWCLFGLCFGSEILDTEISDFHVGSTTVMDKYSDYMRDYYSSVASSTLTLLSSTTQRVGELFETCSPLSGNFNFLSCLSDSFYFTVLGTSNSWYSRIDTFKNDVLVRWPFGYATRLFSIMSGSSTTTLPIVSLTFPSTFPDGIKGQTLTLNVFDNLLGIGSILRTATTSDGTVFYDYFMVWWKRALYFLLGMAILHELIEFGRAYAPQADVYDERTSRIGRKVGDGYDSSFTVRSKERVRSYRRKKLY